MRERHYQAEIIRRLHTIFPDAIVMKNDSSYIQGIPDLTILHGPQWAMLEVKLSGDAPERPNQEFWVQHAHRESFGAFIYPENEDRILNALQDFFGTP